MGEQRDTPPTGTAIPRPRLNTVESPPVVDFAKLPSSPPSPPASPVPPSNPTLEDIYKLIDQRLSTKIVQRISSYPPPKADTTETAKTEAPRPSMPVRAAKATGRWTKWAMAALGVLTIVGEIWADVEKYRGPISQLLVFAAKQMDAHEAPELAPPTPE